MLAKTALKDVDYIKVPHHGSKNGLTQELLEAALPEIAIISVGSKNSYGHPHQEVLDMLESYRLRIFRTDRDGDVEVVSDGKNW
ncbi:MAG: MBL fold metallo-hydrolase, partial [Patescibacteria group bacterium]